MSWKETRATYRRKARDAAHVVVTSRDLVQMLDELDTLDLLRDELPKQIAGLETRYRERIANLEARMRAEIPGFDAVADRLRAERRRRES